MTRNFVRDDAKAQRAFFTEYDETGPWVCCFCGELITHRRSDSNRDRVRFPFTHALTIEHLDGDPSNNEGKNLAPAHSSCNVRGFYERMTLEERSARSSEIAKRAWVSRKANDPGWKDHVAKAGAKGAEVRWANATEEQKAAQVAVMRAGLTPEVLSANGHNMNAKLDPEHRSNNGRKHWEGTTPEERSEVMRERTKKAWASITPEQRAARAKKAWETRRAKQKIENV